MPTLIERVQKAWNAFRNKDPTPDRYGYGYSSYYRPDRRRPQPGTERTIIAPLLNRIAVEAAKVDIRHVRLDDQERYQEDIRDELNDILTLQANLDQTAREFRQDVYASMLDEGYIAVCPIIADVNYSTMSVNKIKSARVGKIKQWYPKEVDVELYNEDTGQKETVRFPKQLCVILQNPFYDVMNAPNSVMARLRRKLAQIDMADDHASSGRMDMIIQLPYSTRHETQMERAEKRRKDIEMQLTDSRYGIAYIDAAEKVIPLSKPLDNNLQAQAESLQKQLYDQIGISPEILNGNADEATEMNFSNNIIEPLISAFADELKRKWLTPTARTKGESILFFKDPFRLVPVSSIADMGDRLIRNEILTANEMRGILGFKPSQQESADQLRNPNMPVDMTGAYAENGTVPEGTVEFSGGQGEYPTNEELPAEDEYVEDEYDDTE